VFGIPGQGAYAAGNAYLDCLARSRDQQGSQTVSLDWVAWQGLGFGAEAQIVVQELERLGSRPVAPEEAFTAWELVSRYDVAQVVMAPMKSAEGDASLISDTHGAASGAARAWSQMPFDELHTELEKGLRTILATELGTSEDQVDSHRPFAEMGLTSVTAMSIRREVEQLVGIELSATMLWNHPTIASLAAYLANTIQPPADADDDAATNDDSKNSLLDSLFDSVESTSAGTESRN
jgi:phthiocerol/phenolphthiocerol synthesis type-I polyketide synthase A